MINQKNLTFTGLVVGITVGLIKIYDFMNDYKKGLKIENVITEKYSWNVNKDNTEELELLTLVDNKDEDLLLSSNLEYVDW